MLPEVEKYLAAREQIEKTYKKKYADIYETKPKDISSYQYFDWQEYDKAHAAYITAYQEWSVENRPALDRLTRERNDALKKARNELAETTSDPIARWMITTLRDSYEGYMRDVLEILPATYEEIEELSVRKAWCSDFDEFVEWAIKDGVIKKRSDTHDATEIVDFIADEFDVYGRIYRRRIQAMVNRIVEKALAEQTAPLKQAS